MVDRIKKFIENNKYFIPLVGISASLLVVLLLGVGVMNFRMNDLSVEYDASLKAFNDANAKLLSENMAAFEKTLLGSFNEQQLVRIAQKNTNTVYRLMVHLWAKTKASYIHKGRQSLFFCPKTMLKTHSIYCPAVLWKKAVS
jgi:hypothetical protein